MNNSTTHTKPITAGKFKTKNLPVLLPIDKGLCLQVDEGIVQNVHLQLQSCAFELIENIGIENLKITVIDLDIRANFPDFAQLNQANDKVTVIRESKDAINAIQNIVTHAREIDQKLGTASQNLHQYNLKTTQKEPFHLLLVANFPNQLEVELPRLQALLLQSERFGIYFLGSLDVHYLTNCEARIRQTILSIFKQMPFGFPTAKGYNFQNIPDVIIKTIDSFGFDWALMPVAKIEANVRQLNEKIQALKKQDSKRNFLSIEIGKVNNQPFFFELGNGADAFHALIAGKTGYGKTSLLKLIIEGIEKYDTKAIQFYVIDRKEDADFVLYRNHKNLVQLYNDEFLEANMLAFFNGILEEAKRRTNLKKELAEAKQVKVADIEDYNAHVAEHQKLPHLVLIIDETDVLLQNKKAIGYINLIAKKYRSVGINMILSFNTTYGISEINDLKSNIGLKIAFRLETNASTYGFNDSIEQKFKTLEPFTCLYQDKTNEVIVKLNKPKN